MVIWGIYMTDGDEKYKLGELTADMAAVKSDVLEIKVTQKEIIAKIDNLNAVSVERWEKRNKYVDDKFSEHEQRFEALEDINKLRESSIWTKIGRAFEKNLVNYIGAGILIFAISVAYIYLRNDLEQSKAPIINTKE